MEYNIEMMVFMFRYSGFQAHLLYSMEMYSRYLGKCKSDSQRSLGEDEGKGQSGKLAAEKKLKE